MKRLIAGRRSPHRRAGHGSTGFGHAHKGLPRHDTLDAAG